MNKVNMHIHSIASDGVLSGVDIVKKAQKANLEIISITDHDSMSEVQNAVDYSKQTNIRVIPGVELTANYSNGICHILGYDIPIVNSTYFDRIKKNRIDKAKKIIDMLIYDGYNITYEEVLCVCTNGVIGRRDISKILVKHKYFTNENDAIKSLFEKNKPYYVETKKPEIEECISLIKENGGYAIIAHPWTLNLELSKLKEFLLFYDFDGIEVYNHNISDNLFEKLNNLANELDMYKTCGTDYHGHKGLNDFIVNKDVDCSKILCKIRRGDKI